MRVEHCSWLIVWPIVWPLVAGSAAGGCTTTEPDTPTTAATPSDVMSVEFGAGAVGIAAVPPADTDEVPVFELDDIDIAAIDAAVDVETDTLVWIDPHATLWVAPRATAPQHKRRIADQAILGVAAAHGQVAYAVRNEGPDTAAFVHDLRTGETAALSDEPGPDEVLGFSPAGDEVLLLSGRTGLASLFAASVATPTARQLTNVGLAPGRGLDPARVTPAPAHRRDVQWTGAGIRYTSAGALVAVPVEVLR